MVHDYFRARPNRPRAQRGHGGLAGAFPGTLAGVLPDAMTIGFHTDNWMASGGTPSQRYWAWYGTLLESACEASPIRSRSSVAHDCKARGLASALTTQARCSRATGTFFRTSAATRSLPA